MSYYKSAHSTFLKKHRAAALPLTEKWAVHLCFLTRSARFAQTDDQKRRSGSGVEVAAVLFAAPQKVLASKRENVGLPALASSQAHVVTYKRKHTKSEYIRKKPERKKRLAGINIGHIPHAVQLLNILKTSRTVKMARLTSSNGLKVWLCIYPYSLTIAQSEKKQNAANNILS